MGPFVYYQFTTCFKCFSALITMKTFLTSLGTSVYHLMMIMLKYFWTEKVSHQCGVSSVYHHFTYLHKSFRTLTTMDWSLASMGSSMYYQFPTCLNVLRHWSQGKCFSPVWVLLCTTRSPIFLNCYDTDHIGIFFQVFSNNIWTDQKFVN